VVTFWLKKVTKGYQKSYLLSIDNQSLYI